MIKLNNQSQVNYSLQLCQTGLISNKLNFFIIKSNIEQVTLRNLDIHLKRSEKVVNILLKC